jgi:TolA-binding protein
MDTKQTSKVLDQALLRVANLEAIDPQIDFGKGLSLGEFTALAQSVQTSLREHNAAIAVVNQTTQSIQDMEKRLVEMGDRLVMGIACKHGTQSEEYQMLQKIKRKASPRTRAAGTTTETRIGETTGSSVKSLVGSVK